MAMVSVPVAPQQFLCFSSKSISRITTTTPSLPFPHFSAILLRNNIPLSRIISCSSSSSSSSQSQTPEPDTQTSESCVNLGLHLFSKGRVKDALTQFETALTLNPNPLESQAALYNKACCHAYRYNQIITFYN